MKTSSAQQSPEPSSLTLQQAVRIALEKNPLRKAALAESNASSADIRAARSVLLPHLSFSETATRGNDPVYVFGGKLRQQRFTEADFALNKLNTPLPFGNFTTRFGGSWNLFDSFASWYSVNRAKAMNDAAAHQLDRTDQEIIFRVVSAYYEVLLASKQLEVAEQAAKTAQSIMDRSQARFDSGLVVESDLLTAKLPILALLLWSVIAGFAGCSGEQQQAAPARETVRNVPVLAVQRVGVLDLLEAVGTVRAAQTSILASQMMGNVVEIRVHEGDRVQRGQVLALIDDSQPRAAVDRATAADHAAEQQLVAADSDLALAESTLKRYQNLYEKKSVSPQEFDEVKGRQQAARARRDMARADQAQAKAALTQARTSLDYTRIRAPFDGVVTEKKADLGTLASPGMAIFTVEDVRRYRLEATVNETDLPYLRIGQPVPVLIDALGNAELKGKVVQMVPAADPASRSFLVKIELPADTRLRSGLFGRAQFSRGERQSLLIPRTAVLERGQLQGVFVLDQNKVAALRYVALGKPSGENVEVLAGLQSGERIVAKPGDLDLNGKRVEAE